MLCTCQDVLGGYQRPRINLSECLSSSEGFWNVSYESCESEWGFSFHPVNQEVFGVDFWIHNKQCRGGTGVRDTQRVWFSIGLVLSWGTLY